MNRAIVLLPIGLVYLALLSAWPAAGDSIRPGAVSVNGCAPAITVTSTQDSGAGSLRQAVADVCGNGTIDFGLTYPNTIALTTQLAITRSMTLQGPGAPLLAIAGSRFQRVLTISAEIVRLRGLTIRDGSTVNGLSGAGIYNESTLFLEDDVFAGNGTGHPSSAQGGALFNSGQASLDRVTFIDNRAASGSGIHNDGAVTLTRVLMDGNGGGNLGGGITNDGIAVVSTSTLSNNEYSIYNLGTFTLTHTTVYSNVVGRHGEIGAIENYGAIVIENSTVSGSGDGAILNHDTGIVTLASSTIASNTGNIFFVSRGINNQGIVTMVNTIVAGNDFDCAGAVTSLGHNLDSDGSCGLSGPGDKPATNPLLRPLADHGGPTLTHALWFGSPAIDAGDNQACRPDDQRGRARPVDGDADGLSVCDIGAYELQLTRAYLPCVQRYSE